MSEPILCPECGHNIDDAEWRPGQRDWGCGDGIAFDCDCTLSPADIARALLAERDAKLAAVRELDLSHRWEWQPTINWALDRCDVCGEEAVGRLSGDFEGLPTVLPGEFLPRQLVFTGTGYACAEHVAKVAALVERRGAEAIVKARRVAP